MRQIVHHEFCVNKQTYHSVDRIRVSLANYKRLSKMWHSLSNLASDK